MDVFLLSWWDKTYMLQIVLIYNGMNLINTLRRSHLISYWCLAGKSSQWATRFHQKSSLDKDSVWMGQLTGENSCNQELILAYLCCLHQFLPRAHFAPFKNTLKSKFECLRKYLGLDQFNCSEKARWKAFPNRWGHLNLMQHFHLGSAMGFASGPSNSYHIIWNPTHLA